MSLSEQLSAELKRLSGFNGPELRTVSLNAPGDAVIAIDIAAVDSMSSAIREIRLRVPSLANAGFDALKEWAQNLSRRVTYLLEGIGPLEFDEKGQQVLIRSTPPENQAGATRFYEVLLKAHAAGNFSLRRYSRTQPGGERAQVNIQATHELLRKLVNDLVETIPVVSR